MDSRQPRSGIYALWLDIIVSPTRRVVESPPMMDALVNHESLIQLHALDSKAGYGRTSECIRVQDHVQFIIETTTDKMDTRARNGLQVGL